MLGSAARGLQGGSRPPNESYEQQTRISSLNVASGTTGQGLLPILLTLVNDSGCLNSGESFHRVQYDIRRCAFYGHCLETL